MVCRRPARHLKGRGTLLSGSRLGGGRGPEGPGGTRTGCPKSLLLPR